MTFRTTGPGANKPHIDVVDAETLRVTCSSCGDVTVFKLAPSDVKAWQDGKHIQNVWPMMSVDDRELLLSGTCGPCFDRMFPDE